ncbi:MAG: hypothetical protein ACFFCK_05860 [Promethearchaeota archaeon]
MRAYSNREGEYAFVWIEWPLLNDRRKLIAIIVCVLAVIIVTVLLT